MSVRPPPLLLCQPLPLPRGLLGLRDLPQGLLQLRRLQLPPLSVSQEGRLREVLLLLLVLVLLSAIIGMSCLGTLGNRDKTRILEDLDSTILRVLFSLELKEAQVLLEEGRELGRCEGCRSRDPRVHLNVVAMEDRENPEAHLGA